jgi:hypothetical protein
MNRIPLPIRNVESTTVLGLRRSGPRGPQNYALNGAPCDLEEILGHVGSEHTPPLLVLAVGEEHEIPQVGCPSFFIVRIK